MIEGQLLARKVDNDPPTYASSFKTWRSVSEQYRHVDRSSAYWHWGVDTMPLMDHGGRPYFRFYHRRPTHKFGEGGALSATNGVASGTMG